MKMQNKQIISMLYAFEKSEVLKAIELYTDGIGNAFKQTEKELITEGWSPQKEKPVGRESYYFKGKYWLQSEEMRAKQIKAQMEAYALKKETQKTPKKKPKASKQHMGLKITLLHCPKCDGLMYRQPVCGGCKEGKQGYKIRLICEEDPDHEILL